MGSWGVYLGGLGNLPCGCRHQGWLRGCLKGPNWHLLTFTARGWFSRGGGDGGVRALPLPLLPVHIDKPPGCLSTKMQITPGAPALPLWICPSSLHLHMPVPQGFLFVRFLGVMPALPIGWGKILDLCPFSFQNILLHPRELLLSL